MCTHSLTLTHPRRDSGTSEMAQVRIPGFRDTPASESFRTSLTGFICSKNTTLVQNEHNTAGVIQRGNNIKISATSVLFRSTNSKDAQNIIYKLLDYAVSFYKHFSSLFASYAGLPAGIITFEFSGSKSP